MFRPTIPLDDLIAYLFGEDHSPLAAQVGPWLVASPRFRAFAEIYRDKIRKKARGPRDEPDSPAGPGATRAATSPSP